MSLNRASEQTTAFTSNHAACRGIYRIADTASQYDPKLPIRDCDTICLDRSVGASHLTLPVQFPLGHYLFFRDAFRALGRYGTKRSCRYVGTPFDGSEVCTSHDLKRCM